MHFVIEESSWAWDGENREEYIERIEQLLDRLDVALERGEDFATSTELLVQSVAGFALVDVLWNPEGPLSLPVQVRERLTPIFNQLTCWDETEPYTEFEAVIAGEEVLSPSSVLVHGLVRLGAVVACLPLPGRWSGETPVVVGEQAAMIHFVVDEPTHRRFFRSAMAAQKLDALAAEALAPHAYPDTFFLEGVWGGLRSFEGGYTRVRDSLLRFLAVFDDHGRWVFTDESGCLSPDDPVPGDGRRVPVTNAIVQRRFIGWGLDLAPEKPNVREDGVCRRARTRSLAGEDLYCEWHYKIELHANRVHVHRPTQGSGGRAIVAIFADHLPLP